MSAALTLRTTLGTTGTLSITQKQGGFSMVIASPETGEVLEVHGDIPNPQSLQNFANDILHMAVQNSQEAQQEEVSDRS